jgi:uncharacterized membrane protein
MPHPGESTSSKSGDARISPKEANPSGWGRRSLVVALASLGFCIAFYLALFQWGAIGHVWEPFFAAGSVKVLRESLLARVLPVPDAFLGALGYLAEIIFESVGGNRRYQTLWWSPVLAGLIAIVLAIVAIALVCTQAFAVKAWCTLCLCSALISLVVACLAWRELHAGWEARRAR